MLLAKNKLRTVDAFMYKSLMDLHINCDKFFLVANVLIKYEMKEKNPENAIEMWNILIWLI